MENSRYLFSLRKAQPQEFGQAMELIEQGRAYLKAQGIDQWQQGYPDADCIRGDLAAGKGYFFTDGKEILGYLCIDLDGEPAYQDIKGSWLTGRNAGYMVIHRLAFDAKCRGRGLAAQVFRLAESMCREIGIGSIRIDTDEENKIMQRVLEKSGFLFCGTIWFANSIKIAFEKKIV